MIPSPSSPCPEPSAHKNPKTILVVDDEPLVRDSIKMLLAHDGHLVETAESGPEALTRCAERKFDVVFTDFTMPGMKGDQLAAAIKNQAPNQSVVMITGSAEGFGAASHSVDVVISKPCKLKSLRETMARLFP